MGVRRLRDDIPLNLPPEHETEARDLRNRLLTYRLGQHEETPDLSPGRSLSPRTAQLLAPLVAVAPSVEATAAIRRCAARQERAEHVGRALELEAVVLEEMRTLATAGTIAVKDIAAALSSSHPEEFGLATPRYVGFLRRRLRLFPVRRHGSFVLSREECAKLPHLCRWYGLTEEGDMGDVGDVLGDGRSSASAGSANTTAFDVPNYGVT
jgi:hypothetical protein